MGASIVWLFLLHICICLADEKPSDVLLQNVKVQFTESGKRTIDNIQMLEDKNVVLNYDLLANDMIDFFMLVPKSQLFTFKESITIQFNYKDVPVIVPTTVAPTAPTTAAPTAPPTPSTTNSNTTSTTTSKPPPSSTTASFNATFKLTPDSKDAISTVLSSTNVSIVYSTASTALGSQAVVTLTFSPIARTATVQKVDNHTSAIVVAVIEGLILGAVLFVFSYKTYNRMKLRSAGMSYNDNNINSAFSSNLNNNYYNNSNPSNTRANNPVVQSPDYGYNQPLEMRSQISASQAPRGPTRTESQTPNLFPVSSDQTQPQGDPLHAWDLH